MYDLIIIGGGAAALSAATYALGKRLEVRIIYQNLGGKSGWRQNLTGQEGAEQLPASDAVRSLERYISMQAGVTLHDGVTKVTRYGDGFQIETFRNGTLEAHALIIATGAGPVRLDVPGAEELLGQGLGYSVTTHSHLLEGKTSAVIGSTTRALRGAAELSRTAAKVYLIIPNETNMVAPMINSLQQRPNVEVLVGYNVQEVVGPMNVEELVISHAGKTRRLAVDAAFVDLGLIPHSEIVKGLVQTDDQGFIVIDGHNRTTLPGLFAAGDVTTAFGEQALIAAGDGARAALSAYDYLLARAPQLEAEGAD
ncbi:MAG: NAD(P)/FAD-dependent oxidoreductase [Roseiflexaceae bacterium]|nr:NAD(P)/FAD-dependent oxidoreductase [Roseiflexaceae bacterium]